MPTSAHNVAERIRRMRESHGWTQEKLAEASGLSRDGISRIERGERKPKLETLGAIAAAFDKPLSSLVDQHPIRSKATTAKKQRLRGIAQSLDQAEPWFADALSAAIRLLCRANLRAAKGAEGARKRGTRRRG